MRQSKAAASAHVDRMVKAGSVRREINPDDRREVILNVSPALDEHVNHVHEEMSRWFASITEQIGEETLEKWYEVMIALNGVLNKRIKSGETPY